ncbi:MAG: hypothetical protein GX421_02305 [Caldisericales bacterium]|nr:hypothetical protein [Caldisericales bacterium]
MTDKEKVLHFIKCVEGLEKEPYSKIIHKQTTFRITIDNQITTVNSNKSNMIIENDFPYGAELNSFISKFRDFFNSGDYNSQKIIEILSKHIIYDVYLISELNRINDIWRDSKKDLLPKDIKVINRYKNEEEIVYKYNDAEKIYNEFLYAYYLHQDRNKQIKLEKLGLLKGFTEQIFFGFIEHGFRYLLALKGLINLALFKGYLSDKIQNNQ